MIIKNNLCYYTIKIKKLKNIFLNIIHLFNILYIFIIHCPEKRLLAVAKFATALAVIN